MSKRLHKPGAFVRIPLPDGTYGYGRCREFPYASFYKLRTQEPIDDLDTIAAAPVLFSVGIHKDAHKAWDHIGKRPLEGELLEPFLRAHLPAGAKTCTILSSDGRQWEAPIEDCVGMEKIASWGAQSIAARIADELDGRENAYAAQTRVKLP